MTCRHRWLGTLHCAAFPGPQEIPVEVLAGDVEHTEHIPGDHGLLYEEGEPVPVGASPLGNV